MQTTVCAKRHSHSVGLTGRPMCADLYFIYITKFYCELDYRNNLLNIGFSKANENIIWKNKNKKNLFRHNWLWLLNIINELLVKQTTKDCTYQQSDKYLMN